MGRLKRTSKVLEKAGTRAAAMSSIDLKLDLGNNLTMEAFAATVTDVRGKLDDYNAVLSKADEANNLLTEAEKSLADLSERMLAGVASKYGKNSHEYEKAGGVRKSERKRPVRKAKA